MKKHPVNLWVTISFFASAMCVVHFAGGEETPSYSKHIAPLLQKYCAGCHNDEDNEGALSVEAYASLQRGGEHGPAMLAGDADSSRVVRMLTGKAEPKMPPEDNESPSATDIERLVAWINSGAKGPDGAEPRPRLLVPDIQPQKQVTHPITAVDWSPIEQVIAVGQYGRVELRDSNTSKTLGRTVKVPGKVNSVRFSDDGRQLAIASGVTGLYGEATVIDARTATVVRTIRGHRDTIFSAVLHPQRKILATAGYDQKIILWEVDSGKAIRTLAGHNGAIYDLDFSAGGSTLASASADETIKVWDVQTGKRLDTLGQPLDEQYTVRFSPTDDLIVGGGADNRIRVWQFVSKGKQRINPLVYARFAHERPVVKVAFSADSKTLVSVSDDRSIKYWETRTFTEYAVHKSLS